MTEVEEVQNELNKLKATAAVLQERLNKLNKKKSIKEHIVDILRESCEPLTVNEITESVLKAGYKSQSNNFRNIVAKALLSSFGVHKATKARTRPTRFELSE